MYHAIAQAVGCSPHTVWRWHHLKGDLGHYLLCYLEAKASPADELHRARSRARMRRYRERLRAKAQQPTPDTAP